MNSIGFLRCVDFGVNSFAETKLHPVVDSNSEHKILELTSVSTFSLLGLKVETGEGPC